MTCRTTSTRLLLLSLLTLSLGLTGCDEAEPDPDPDPDPDPLDFSFVDLSDGVAGSFDGNAYFTLEGNEFRLYLFDGAEGSLDTDRSEYVGFFTLSGLPQPGIYDIRLPGHGEARAYAGYARQTPNDLEVAGESGTLTIRTASAERVSGGFEFSGTAYIPGKTGRGTVTGGFQARRSTGALPAYPFVFPDPGE